jgi:hypothetical protein
MIGKPFPLDEGHDSIGTDQGHDSIKSKFASTTKIVLFRIHPLGDRVDAKLCVV